MILFLWWVLLGGGTWFLQHGVGLGFGLGLGLGQCAQVLVHGQSSVVERVHDHVEPQLP